MAGIEASRESLPLAIILAQRAHGGLASSKHKDLCNSRLGEHNSSSSAERWGDEAGSQAQGRKCKIGKGRD
jgi:hypothetical protein